MARGGPLGSEFAQAENIIDANLGDNVRIIPYRKGEYLGDPVLDTSRKEKNGIAVVYGKNTMLRSSVAGSTVAAKRAEADLLISIQEKYLGDTKQGDHVILKDRGNQECEISYIEPSTNARPLVHLLRISS